MDQFTYQIMYKEDDKIKTGKCTVDRLNNVIEDMENEKIIIISITLQIG